MTKAQGQNKTSYQPEYQTPFQKIPQACKTTGLSKYYLRKGCKSGEIPHITSGGVYYINVPELLKQSSLRTSSGESNAIMQAYGSKE